MLFLALGIPNTKNHTSLPKSNSFCNMLQYPSTKRRYYNNAVNFMPSSLLSFFFFLFLSLSLRWSPLFSSSLLSSPSQTSPLSLVLLSLVLFFFRVEIGVFCGGGVEIGGCCGGGVFAMGIYS